MKRMIRTTMLAVFICLLISGCGSTSVAQYQNIAASASTESTSANADSTSSTQEGTSEETEGISLSEVPKFSGNPYVVLEDNQPSFSKKDFSEKSFEHYSSLDELGRCRVDYANVSTDTMPEAERGSIGEVKPTGWHTVKYSCVDGKYLYNRCHLIAYELTAENANKKNLITGTRYLNVEGMLPFENEVADYVKETGNHVLYRVTPIYKGDNLVASGVEMEAESVEDKGKGICFNIYAYNCQPGVTINYKTGSSTLAKTTSAASVKSSGSSDASADKTSDTKQETYILNTNTHKFHKPSCSSVSQMKESNLKVFKGSRKELISEGYSPCKRCNP